MHHSRLAGFIIDCKTPDLEKAAEFWSAALGMELKPKEQESSPIYRQLMTGPDGLHIEIQQVSHENYAGLGCRPRLLALLNSIKSLQRTVDAYLDHL